MSARRADYDPDEVERLYVKEGLTQTKVGKRLGISTTTVSEVLKKRGVDTSRGRRSANFDPDEVVRLYVEEGLTQAEVAERVGIGRWTVSETLKEREIETRTAADYLTPHYDPDEVVRLYIDEGLSIEEVTSRLHIGHRTLRDVLTERGFETRPPGLTPNYDADEIVRLYVDERLTQAEVAERVDVDPSTVNNVLARKGVETRTAADYDLSEELSRNGTYDPEEVVRLYVEEKLTQAQVAEQVQISPKTVSRVLKQHGVETRTRADYRSYDPEEVERLYVEEGLTQAEVAEQVDITPSMVSKVLRKRGVDGRSPSDYLTFDVEEAVRLYVEEELSQAEVAERVGTTPSTVGTLLEEHGVEIRPATHRSFDVDEAVRLYVEEGLTQQQVADRVGTSQASVSQVLRDRDVPTRTAADYQKSTKQDDEPDERRLSGKAIRISDLRERTLSRILDEAVREAVERDAQLNMQESQAKVTTTIPRDQRRPCLHCDGFVHPDHVKLYPYREHPNGVCHVVCHNRLDEDSDE